jgi:hypothetical protein
VDDKKPGDNASRSLFERVMMRCSLAGCRRWISIGPDDSRECPSCSVSGIVSPLEPVDHVAHMASLPKRVDSADDVAKMAAQLAKDKK